MIVRDRNTFNRLCSFGLLMIVCTATTVFGQNAKGIVSGHVVDTVNADLQGAQIKIDPTDRQVISDGQGNF
jgi:hypothetical protein